MSLCSYYHFTLRCMARYSIQQASVAGIGANSYLDCLFFKTAILGSSSFVSFIGDEVIIGSIDSKLIAS